MINTLIELIVSLFDSIICIYFLTKFNKISFKRTQLYVPISAVLILFLYSLINDFYLSGFNTIGTIIFLILYIIYSLVISNIYKTNYIRAILSAFMFEIVFVLLSSFLYVIISMYINDFNQLMQGAQNNIRYIYIIMHKISLFSILKLLLYFFKADHALDLANGALSFFFSLTTIFGLGATMQIVSMVDVDIFVTQVLLITISFIIINIIFYILIGQIQKLLKHRYELKLLEEKLEFEKARHNDSVLIWTNIRKVQHDIKQHLTIISGLLEENEIEDCKEYLHMLLPNVDRLGKIIKSDNKILDYLINSKLSNLKDTKVIISGSIGDLSDIEEFDLACLFGNILDNAIEALNQVDEKQIELLFMRQNSNRIIICKNTINGSVLSNNKELKSTKKSGDHHGYGTKIVSRIVADYNGCVDYYEEFNMFCVQIILPKEH